MKRDDFIGRMPRSYGLGTFGFMGKGYVTLVREGKETKGKFLKEYVQGRYILWILRELVCCINLHQFQESEKLTF